MYTKECVFLLSTFGEMFISKWLLPLEDCRDTVITQNHVRSEVSLYIYQSSAEVGWKWDRALLYFPVCSPPAASAKPFNICFALSLFLEFIPMQEGMCQCNVSDVKRADHSSDSCLPRCRITPCSTRDQISALHPAQPLSALKDSQASKGRLLEWVTALCE